MAIRTKIRDLSNFDDTGLSNKFVVVYDQATNSFKAISADTLLENSLIDESLPSDFIDEVADSISYDGGEGF